MSDTTVTQNQAQDSQPPATPPGADATVSTTGLNLTAGQGAPEGGEQDAQGADNEPQDTGGTDLESKVKKLQDESAQRRIKLRETEKQLAAEKQQRDEMVTMLRKLTGDEVQDTATPEELLEAATKRAAAAEGRIKELEQEQMLRGAIDGVAKASIIPFLKGSGALNDLDQTADDYAGLVKALIGETVEKYPEFATKRLAGSSGKPATPTVDTSNNQLTRADLQSMTSEEILQADRDGRLNHLKNPNK